MDVAGVGQKSCRAGRSDTVEVHQRRSQPEYQLPQLFVRGLGLGVDGLEIFDHFQHQTVPNPGCDVAQFDRIGHGPGLRRRQESLGATGHQLQQQPVDPIEGFSAGPAEFVPALDQQTERDQLRVHLHAAKIRRSQRGHRDRMRVYRIGLAAVTGGEHPHLRRHLRRYVDDRFAIVDQTVRQVSADTIATLDRPHPLGETLCRSNHFAVSGGVCAVPAGGQDLPVTVDDFDGGRAFVQVHPDDDRHRFPSRSRDEVSVREGTATSSWANPFQATPRTAPGETQAMSEPHQ
ncbi:hypothetical protein OG563_28635 [Nocardia vinacea]|uniref:Uncharacterized protein n=1 Tax=Nocardia vinacea TaxID=96468 RepID=A0ABZ1YJG8_9NOCA|nr:hypothetical protein [Nocardia vinacea]